MLGRTSLIRLNLIGVSLVSNQRKPLDKALKLIELRLLMASFDLINLEVSQKEDWFDLSSYGALKMSEVKVVSIFKEKNAYYAALPYEEKIEYKSKTHQKTAVDVNVGHFNYTDGQINVLPVKLQKLYKRIKHYQRMLARKREINGKSAIKSNNYSAVRTKLQKRLSQGS